MPTYDYFCKVCSSEFEAFQSITEKPAAECPQCKVMCHNRLISTGTSFVLQGEGWAVDNYAKKNPS